MQFVTEPNRNRVKFNSLLECPKHPHNAHCFLCSQREPEKPCSCPMCLAYAQKQEYERSSKMTQHLAIKIAQKLSNRKLTAKPLEDVLQFLLYPHHKTITHPLGMFIPEICFYKDGEADALYCNAEVNDKKPGIWPPAVLKIRKEKLTNTQIQKVFNEKRRKYRDKVSKAHREFSKHRASLQKRESVSEHERRNQKLANLKEKTAKGTNPTQSKLIEQKKSIKRGMTSDKKQQAAPEPKDAVVICISSKEETYQELRQQNYFIGLMLRRKQDPIFKPINFIKNFIGVEDEDSHILFCKHEDCNPKYPQLLARSKVISRVMATNILPGESLYISPDEQALFLLDLATRSPDCYAYYTLYKLVSYVQTFNDVKITLISAKFLLNELKELYLLHVYSLQRQELVKYSWNQETYLRKVAQNEQKLLARSPQLELNQPARQRSCLIQGQMKEQYESLKTAMGLGKVEQNDLQQHKNNSFFAVLHPGLPNSIAQLLKDKSMTVQRFQRKYLGYRDKKKPVAAGFNSNLVKTSHKMAPALRAAEGHQIENRQFPGTASLHRRSAIDKRSFSQGNTISTFNRTTIFL